VSFKTALSLFQKIPPIIQLLRAVFIGEGGAGKASLRMGEQGTRRLVGHWVLLSRFGSNGMGPRVGWWALGERGPDKI
jgi:hypothetical protein